MPGESIVPESWISKSLAYTLEIDESELTPEHFELFGGEALLIATAFFNQGKGDVHPQLAKIMFEAMNNAYVATHNPLNPEFNQFPTHAHAAVIEPALKRALEPLDMGRVYDESSLENIYDTIYQILEPILD